MDNARSKMCYSLSPPPPSKTIFSSNLTLACECRTNHSSVQNYHEDNRIRKSNNNQYNMQRKEDTKILNDPQILTDTASDYKQWLHAMKLVARLPGGIPPEFRRKLWLSLADKYLKLKNVDWSKEEQKCFCEKWREDDEELGVQIVKDLHRTGSTLCTGPAGDLNQAKLKKVLLGYARYNPEVGYCQGFNMLGALILQVMDKDEAQSIKVMIYLVEGILPNGYFCGSMGGLQADMAVFRELMQSKLPRLAKHLQKLQGPIENAYEPPLTNVFTMQWFLTMFCTCLPMSCVLRVWDLVLIEGSDVLLRTALALWSLLEERVLNARSADDFYGKMGSFSSELLNGHLIDSNGLIEKVVQLGPIDDIQKLREKHLYSIAPIQHQQGLQLYYDDDEPDIDEDSRLAVATVWGLSWGRRGSQGQSNNSVAKQAVESRDRIALDISLLKKQYDRLRERQKQAHIILTTACSTASRSTSTTNVGITPLAVNQLLSGRTAIITNKGRRNGPPTGAIPPARKPSLPTVLQDKPLQKKLRRRETLQWRDTKQRRDSLSWKEIRAEREALISSGSIDELKSQKNRISKLGKSDSSSYSDESDANESDGGDDASSTDTSLCDEELQTATNGIGNQSDNEAQNKKHLNKIVYKPKKTSIKGVHVTRPKSWNPSNNEIPFVLMTTETPTHSDDDEKLELDYSKTSNNILKDNERNDRNLNQFTLPASEFNILKEDSPNIPIICSSSFNDSKSKNKNVEKGLFKHTTLPDVENERKIKNHDISNDGVINEYFERVNSSERPTKLDLLYSLNGDENVLDDFRMRDVPFIESNAKNSNRVRCLDLLVDYSEKSSAACIEDAKTEISSTFQSVEISPSTSLRKNNIKDDNMSKGSIEKRRDPRRLTLTRSTTMDIEKRYQALEKRLSMEICSKNNLLTTENGFNKRSHLLNLCNSNSGCGVMELQPNKSTIFENKKIPSTADLEERFKNMQQQLIKDKNQITKSPYDSEATGKQSNIKSSTHNNPSPTDDKNESSKKSDNFDEGTGETQRSDNKLTAHLDFRNKSSTSVEIGESATRSSNKVSEDVVVDKTKCAPAKTNLLEHKKEPPDDNKNINDYIRKNTLSSFSSRELKTEKAAIEEKRLDSIEQVEIFNSNIAGEWKQDISEEEDSKDLNHCEPNRTPPPSTEELEKRFCALEEQMNSTKVELHEKCSDVQFEKQAKHNLCKELNKSDGNTKRRLSEPPSTEDLEKRYEVLKRRMSSRNFDAKTLQKDVTEHCSIKNTLPEEKIEKPKNTTEIKVIKQSPPSTGDLEKRFETLQNKNEIYETRAAITNSSAECKTSDENNLKENSITKTAPSGNLKNKAYNKNQTEQPITENKLTEDQSNIGNIQPEHPENIKESSADVENKTSDQIKIRIIEELQAKIKEHCEIIDIDIESSIENKMALIDELKYKIKPLSNEIVRPTQIPSKRQLPTQNVFLPSQSFNDETLESHATSADSKSKKYEPTNCSNRKMVRRFSDLPSRADLENRLQFLEEQLSKTVCMQRRSSDSEVASKYRCKPSAVNHTAPLNNSLEYRVQELEKHMHYNRNLSMDVECSKTKENNRNDPEMSPLEVGTSNETIAVTGKELVRYSSHGEVGEIDQNPINISINIQMTLNKDDIRSKNKSDLDSRLQYLEQQLKSSQAHVTLGNAKKVKEDDSKTIKLIENSNKENIILVEEEHKTLDYTKTTEKVSQETYQLNNENESHFTTNKSINISSTEMYNEKSNRNEADIEFAENDRKDNNFEEPKTSNDNIIEVKASELTNKKIQKPDPNNYSNEKNVMKKTEQNNSNENKENANEKKEVSNEVVSQVQKNDKNEKLVDSLVEGEANVCELCQEENIINDTKTNEQDLIQSDISFNENQDKSNKVTENVTYENVNKIDNCLVDTSSQFVPVEVNKKTLVLLLDNVPKAMKVRRLTRANTEELEDLFQAIEKQLNHRGQEKNNHKKSMTDEKKNDDVEINETMLNLAKEIQNLSKNEIELEQKESISNKKKTEENFDWGNDPIKYHLKKRTVYLPSTKELEARFRSLERQIKLLEDVEKIDVEQRLTEIERKIKLQYSLSHEKDMNKFLELCEGKEVESIAMLSEKNNDQKECYSSEQHADQKFANIHTSPSRSKFSTPSVGNLEHSYRSLELKRSRSKQNFKKQPIHPLEMLLDPSPDENDIPTTGELEHRIRLMEDNKYTPSPPSRKSRSQSPPTKDQQIKTRNNNQTIEKIEVSPAERELPTTEELEARLEALEKEQSFNLRMQKNFQQFNQKLKDVVSPSLSFDEFKTSIKPIELEKNRIRSPSPKQVNNTTVSPKTIRFRENEKSQIPPTKDSESMKEKSILDFQTFERGSKQEIIVPEGLGKMRIRLMKETSPLRRKGTHTGVPLRTGENINDQLTSIQNTIKSIDSLCEEKSYKKEKCLQYIDALFSDSTYFSHKKTSLEDLTSHNISRSTSREIGPSIRIIENSPVLTRSMGSADSIQSSSPLRSSSTLQYRSNRDLRRDPSPRRQRDEDREEHESRFHKVDSQLIPNDVEHELEESLRHSIFSPTDNSQLYHDNIITSKNISKLPQRPFTTTVTAPDTLKSHHEERPISPFHQIVLPSTNTPLYTPAKLEIRHTTVTSTFYDRVLTEKQLEKRHQQSAPTINQPPNKISIIGEKPVF
ncbi:uncharacterized protein ACRADG_012618 isoform 3-T4 [Cochliomyia hominivorax]